MQCLPQVSDGSSRYLKSVSVFLYFSVFLKSLWYSVSVFQMSRYRYPYWYFFHVYIILTSWIGYRHSANWDAGLSDQSTGNHRDSRDWSPGNRYWSDWSPGSRTGNTVRPILSNTRVDTVDFQNHGALAVIPSSFTDINSTAASLRSSISVDTPSSATVSLYSLVFIGPAVERYQRHFL